MTLVQQSTPPEVEPARPVAPREENAGPTQSWWWVAVWAVVFAAGIGLLLLGVSAFVGTFVAGFGAIGAGESAWDAYSQRRRR